MHLCSSLLILTSTSHIFTSHLHLTSSPLFLTFSLKAGGSAAGPPRNATLCGDGARRKREMQARVRFGPVRDNPLRGSRASSARNAGESAICPCPGQPSAEIVRVERAKCRRECDLARSGTTLCGDRARRVREMQARVRFACVSMQARVRFVPVRDNPLRRSCASSARNAGDGAMSPMCGVSGELEDESWRLASATVVRGVSGELEAENWRLCSTT